MHHHDTFVGPGYAPTKPLREFAVTPVSITPDVAVAAGAAVLGYLNSQPGRENIIGTTARVLYREVLPILDTVIRLDSGIGIDDCFIAPDTAVDLSSPGQQR
jgi:hypothetical protein